MVLFGLVKPELGVIPSGQENHSRAEHLNFHFFKENIYIYIYIYIYMCVCVCVYVYLSRNKKINKYILL